MDFRPAAFLVLLLTGCYVYQPVRPPMLQPGDHVRLTLTDSGSASLAAQLGPAAQMVSGRFLRDSADSYAVAVSEIRRSTGVEIGWSGDPVAVARPLIASVEQRRFSRNRSLLVGVGAVLASIVVREAFWGEGGAFGGAPPGPGPTPR